MKLLLVIAGPIGAGKSTVADLVGTKLSSSGATAAVVDLDDIAFMQRGVPGHKLWRRAAVAARALIDGWFAAKTDVVVAHGPFFEAEGFDVLLRDLSEDVAVRHVLLRVSYGTALGRVAADDRRGMSKDPEFLRGTHERFAELEQTFPPADYVFDTEGMSAEQIAEAIAAAVSTDVTAT